MKKILLSFAILVILAGSEFANTFSRTPDSNITLRMNTLAFFEQPEKEIELYPNPVTEGHITIKASDNIVSVQVLNIAGKIVFNGEFQSNTNSVTLEINKLEKGIYLVRINFEDKELHTEKIMVK